MRPLPSGRTVRLLGPVLLAAMQSPWAVGSAANPDADARQTVAVHANAACRAALPPLGPTASMHDESDYGKSLLSCIDNLIRAWRYAEAEARLRDALTEIDAAGNGSLLLRALIEERRLLLMFVQDLGTAESKKASVQEVLAIKESILGPDAVETARTLLLLGRIYISTDNFPDAQRVLERSLRILEASNESVSADVAGVMFYLGTMFSYGENSGAGEHWLKRALAAYEAVYGQESPEFAVTLGVLGDLYTVKLDVEQAKALWRRSVLLLERAQGPDHPQLAWALSGLGQTFYLDDEFAEARASFDRAVAILKKSGLADSGVAAGIYLVAVGFLVEVGDYTMAASLAEEALGIYTRVYGPDSSRVAPALHTLAMVRFALGDYAAAAGYFEQSSRRSEARPGPAGFDLAQSLHAWARALARLGRYVEAEKLMKRSLAIFSQALGPDNETVANALTDLATEIYEPEGEYQKAAESAGRAVALLQASAGPDSSRLIPALNSLALAAHGAGDLAEALRLSERALGLQVKSLSSFHRGTAGLLVIRARLMAEAGARAQALDLAVRGETAARVHLSLVMRGLSQSGALTYAATRDSGINLLMTLAAEDPPGGGPATDAAWDQVIRARALVLDEMVDRHRLATTRMDPELAHLADEMHRTSERLAGLVIKGPGEGDIAEFNARVNAANEARERAERNFAARSEEYRHTLEDEKSGLERVAASLPDQSALVAFVRYGRLDLVRPMGVAPAPLGASLPTYAAFVLSSASAKPVLVPLGEAASIDSLVARWRESIRVEIIASGRSRSRTEMAYRAVATEVRRAIWDPVAAQLGDVEHVFVVQDGALNLVNLAALPVGAHEYVVERDPVIQYLSSERDLLLKSDAMVVPGGLLALSNPDFEDRALFAALRTGSATSAAVVAESGAPVYRGQRSACGSFQSMRFESLPASAQEASAVTALWTRHVPATIGGSVDGQSTREVVELSGAVAGETGFKRNASGHRALHLATHGFFLGGQCASALDSSTPPVDSASGTSMVTRENPLLLSGLVLAGANHRDVAGPDEDDGILTAEEIATLDLHGTEWAVLSACDTGMGEIRAGEGVFGLRRAFQLAGARTVIMSLWPVEDESTRQWMTSLYRHRLVEGHSTIESVNGASRDMLKERRARGESTHPFYWAGFIAAGDWR